MGIIELQSDHLILLLHANLVLYGNAASAELADTMAKEINEQWNEPKAFQVIGKIKYQVVFNVQGTYAPELQPQDIFENDNPLNNYFRIEEFVHGNISFVDGLKSNTGYFKLENLLNNSTTAAHEFGHTIGLDHPEDLDIRNHDVPGIMYPRGTLVAPHFQYDPDAVPQTKGGTLNPFHRKVLQKDINDLKIDKLSFNKNGYAIIGDYSSVWHDQHIPH